MDSLRWLRRKFMPSRALSAYIIGMQISRFLVILLVLVAILQSLDLLNRSDDIMDATGDTAALWQYVRLRAPELVSQFIPFAVLLGTLFSFYTLAQNSEIVIMRASGMAPGQVAAPMVVGGLIIATGHLLFHDIVTVPSSGQLKYWQDNDYAMTEQVETGGRNNLWLTDDTQVLEARSAAQIADQIILENIFIHKVGSDGLITESKAAELAVHSGDSWVLYNVRRFDLEGHVMTTVESLPWVFGLPVDQIFARTDRPKLVRIKTLSDAIDTLRSAGAETFTLATSLHHRIAQALSSAMMPLMAIFVAFSVPRGGVAIGRVVGGMGVGFSYFVIDNYMVAMGSMGVVPPVIAAYGALAVFFLTGLSFLARMK